MPIQEHEKTIGGINISSSLQKKIQWGVLALAVFGVVVFLSSNVPVWWQNYRADQEQRALFDERRIKHLQTLQAAIEAFYSKNGYYPASHLVEPYISSSDNFRRTENNAPVWIDSLLQEGGVSIQPIDPLNEGEYVYRYKTGKPPALTYELDCKLEHSDAGQNDGGNNPDRYEVGNDLTQLD